MSWWDHGGIGGLVPPKFPWYCIWKFWFQDLAARDHEQIPIQVVATQTFFYVHPYRYLEKWSNLTNTFKMGCHDPLEKIPIFVVSSIFTFTPTCRNGLKWPTSNVLQPHPSQITFSVSRRPKQPKVQIQSTWSILAVYMNGVWRWNRSMVDQPTSYI